MKVAITGAGGFLGPYVGDAFAAASAEVRALVGAGDVRAPANATVVAADICNGIALKALLRGCDVAVHLAGPASVAASFAEPARYVRVHTEGTATLLDACRAEGVRRLVYVSSAEVYGRPQSTPVREEHPLSARSPYGAAKIGAEKLVESFVHAGVLDAAVLRPFSIYGPGASPVSLIPRIIAMARRREPIVLRDLRPVRDYCFAEDFARAVVAACAPQGFQVFNVGTMRGVSVERVAATVVELLGVDVVTRETPERERPGDSEILELVADNRRITERLGWRPTVSLEEGLRRTLCAS